MKTHEKSVKTGFYFKLPSDARFGRYNLQKIKEVQPFTVIPPMRDINPKETYALPVKVPYQSRSYPQGKVSVNKHTYKHPQDYKLQSKTVCMCRQQL